MKEAGKYKRLWIPIIGWTLCYGIFYNCVIQPIARTDVISWEHLLIGMGIMLGSSAARDIGLKKKGQDDYDELME